MRKPSKFTLTKVDTRTILESKKSLGLKSTFRNYSVTGGNATPSGTHPVLPMHIGAVNSTRFETKDPLRLSLDHSTDNLNNSLI